MVEFFNPFNNINYDYKFYGLIFHPSPTALNTFFLFHINQNKHHIIRKKKKFEGNVKLKLLVRDDAHMIKLFMAIQVSRCYKELSTVAILM